MNTAKTTPTVKHALLEKLHQEIVPELEQLIQQMPDQLLDFQQAETRLRNGLLKVAHHLLENGPPSPTWPVGVPVAPNAACPCGKKGGCRAAW